MLHSTPAHSRASATRLLTPHNLVHCTRPQDAEAGMMVLAEGGRYDDLVARHTLRFRPAMRYSSGGGAGSGSGIGGGGSGGGGGGTQLLAVGVRFLVDRLASVVGASLRRIGGAR
jgi:hypothetical protein